MFKEMRRIEKQLSISRTEEILCNGEYGVLSTIGSNGYPYGVPVNYIYMNNNMYIHGAMEGHKIDNISSNSKASFCVVDNSEVIPNKFDTHYESVICFGNAEEIEGEEKELVLKKFIDKYSKDFQVAGEKYINNSKNKTAIIKVNIEHMTGKIGR